ncbi:hypothetical protein ACWD2L_00340 [Streptomyces sp. NPDC002754]
MNRWHGKHTKAKAWQACTETAQAITAAGLARRYGVKVDRRRYVNGRFRDVEYRLVLVDRTPDEPRPAAVERLYRRCRGPRLVRSA